MSTLEVRERGAKLAEMQRRLGIRSDVGAEGGQVEVRAIGFDRKGNPTVVVADGKVVGGEMEGWIAVAGLLAREAGLEVKERIWRRVKRKKRPIVIGGLED